MKSRFLKTLMISAAFVGFVGSAALSATMNYLGSWSNVTSYKAGSVVIYNNGIYYSLKSTAKAPNRNYVPSTNPTWWTMVGTVGNTILSGPVNPTSPNLGRVGDFYINTQTNTIFGPKSEFSPYWPADGTLLAGSAGATGPQGVAGPAGPTGPAGPAGVDGVAGTAGPAGPTGATGPAGPAGADGVAGATGPAGPTGATGPAGPQGVAGPAGADGPAGPQGVAGAIGPAGPAGATGATGAQGPAGTVGTIGYLVGTGQMVAVADSGNWRPGDPNSFVNVNIGPSGLAYVFVSSVLEQNDEVIHECGVSVIVTHENQIVFQPSAGNPLGNNKAAIIQRTRGTGTKYETVSGFLQVYNLPQGVNKFEFTYYSDNLNCSWRDNRALIIPQ